MLAPLDKEFPAPTIPIAFTKIRGSGFRLVIKTRNKKENKERNRPKIEFLGASNAILRLTNKIGGGKGTPPPPGSFLIENG